MSGLQPRLIKSESRGAGVAGESAFLTSIIAKPRVESKRKPGMRSLEGRGTDRCNGQSHPSRRLSLGTHQCQWPAAWWSVASARGSGGSRHSRSASWLWRSSPASCQPCCPARAIHPLERERASPQKQNLLRKNPSPTAFTGDLLGDLAHSICYVHKPARELTVSVGNTGKRKQVHLRSTGTD